MPELIGYLHSNGVHALFAFGSEPDAKDSMMEIAGTDQGGLGLPDRDYYLKTDEKSVALRKAYVEHVTKMFQLMGESPDNAAADAKTVMTIETALATASMDRVERRDPNKVYHKMTTAQLQELSPAFVWKGYFDTINAPVLHQPGCFGSRLREGNESSRRHHQLGRHEDVSALAGRCIALPSCCLRPSWKRTSASTARR